MKILVKITQETINASKGCELQVTSCLIARACQEIFESCMVYGTDTNCFTMQWKNFKIALPEEARLLANKFDKRHIITPISFEIDIPMSIIEKIGIREAYRVLSESKTLELVHI